MKKMITSISAVVITMLFSAVSHAQFSHYFAWCPEPNMCEITVGSSHAKDNRLNNGNYRYDLVISDFYMNPNVYMHDSSTGAEMQILRFGGYSDSFGRQIEGLCIGGAVCGDKNSVYLPLLGSSERSITKIEVDGHDNVHSGKKANLALYDGNKLIGLRDVKSEGGTYSFNVTQPIAGTLKLSSIRGSGPSTDETVIDEIRIYTEMKPSIIYPGQENCQWISQPNSFAYEVSELHCDESGVVAQKVIQYPWSYGSNVYACNIQPRNGAVIETVGTGTGDANCTLISVRK